MMLYFSKKFLNLQSFCCFEQKLGFCINILYNVIADENMKTIYREQYINKLISLKDKNIIKVLTGIRRCGKSTILQEFKNYLLQNNVNKENIIFLNLNDKSNKHLLDSDILHDYILNNINTNKQNYIFLDEIQNVPEFEKCINSLFLKDNIDIYNRFKFL